MMDGIIIRYGRHEHHTVSTCAEERLGASASGSNYRTGKLDPGCGFGDHVTDCDYQWMRFQTSGLYQSMIIDMNMT